MSSEKRLSAEKKLRHLKFKVYRDPLMVFINNRSLRYQRKLQLMGNNFLLYFKVTKYKSNF